ncbi:MAG: DUF3467 domain-containing protein, partial [Desulfobaccales bacterium]
MADSVGKENKPKEIIGPFTVELVPRGEPRFGRVYSNFFQVSHSPWEFNIRFCIAPVSTDIKFNKKEDKTVVDASII